jgi:hypothetical protein
VLNGILDVAKGAEDALFVTRGGLCKIIALN